MFSEKQECRISVRAIVAAALLYLLLPNLLFLAGWVRPVFAFPLIALLVAGVFCVWKHSFGDNSDRATCIRCSKKDYVYLIGALLFALALVDIIGFHGHVTQGGDFRVRNPIYQTLIEQDWPIFSERGEYFIYYHITWLVPALICKICGEWLSPATALFCWMYLGICIALSVLFLRLRRHVFVFLLILFGFGTISTLLHETMVFFIPLNETGKNWLELTVGRGGYTIFYVQWVQFFNHVLPCMICLALYWGKCLPLRYYAVPAALMVMSSPMAAVSLFVVLVFVYLRHLCEIPAAMRSWQVWACVALLICAALYLMGQHSSETRLLWSENPYSEMMSPLQREPEYRIVRYLTGLVWLLLPLYFMLQKKIRRSMWWKIVVSLAVVLPLIWIGRHDNQLVKKGGLVLSLLCAWLLTYQWKIATFRRRVFISLVLICSAAHLAGDFINRDFRHYTWSKEGTERHVYDPWGGTLNHPELYEYNNFWGVVLAPKVLYNQPGEAASALGLPHASK